MKITLATAFFLCAFVAFVKANSFAGLGDLEDELEAFEIQDPPMGPPKPPVDEIYATEALLECFRKKHGGMMDKNCIQEFKKLLPANTPRAKKRRLIRCAVSSFEHCHKKPKHHEVYNCMKQFSDCVNNVFEGSG